MKTFIDEKKIQDLLPSDVQLLQVTTRELSFFKEEYSDTYIDMHWRHKKIQIQLLSRGDSVHIQFSRNEMVSIVDEEIRLQSSKIIERIANWLLHKSKLRLQFLTAEKQLVLDWWVIANLHEYPFRLEGDYLQNKKTEISTYFKNAKIIADVTDHKEKKLWALRIYGRDGVNLAEFLEEEYKVEKTAYEEFIEVQFIEDLAHYAPTLYLYHRFQDLGYTLMKEEKFDKRRKTSQTVKNEL